MTKNTDWDKLQIVKKDNTHFEIQLLYGHIYTSPIKSYVWNSWEIDSVHKSKNAAEKRKKYLENLKKEGIVIE